MTLLPELDHRCSEVKFTKVLGFHGHTIRSQLRLDVLIHFCVLNPCSHGTDETGITAIITASFARVHDTHCEQTAMVLRNCRLFYVFIYVLTYFVLTKL